ncbi:MAG: polymer-forming cytoskeletal protein [Chitinophagaceae bacterium]|nr:polymer-forming cytoskeletal protein [Chitinophagaceae bacterium]MBK9379993.1 polymer-forming cytoskeletal protein [Chitinophagaceae bacterium]MBL0305290.1 polymer-forming cytoskeletal protein [Chitinophagaceae bacterium]
MFNTKNKTEMQQPVTNGNGGATLISSGTILKGDISSNNDLRIDGTVIGNVNSSAKIIVGTSGVVEGDIAGNQADITGKVSGNIRAKELLQLRGDCLVTGNLYAGKLQVEPSATFNGQCHMGANIVEMSTNEQAAAIQ